MHRAVWSQYGNMIGGFKVLKDDLRRLRQLERCAYLPSEDISEFHDSSQLCSGSRAPRFELDDPLFACLLGPAAEYSAATPCGPLIIECNDVQSSCGSMFAVALDAHGVAILVSGACNCATPAHRISCVLPRELQDGRPMKRQYMTIPSLSHSKCTYTAFLSRMCA